MSYLIALNGRDSCHGCKHCWYSAPGSTLPIKPYVHSRCTKFAVDLPMILGDHGK